MGLTIYCYDPVIREKTLREFKSKYGISYKKLDNISNNKILNSNTRFYKEMLAASRKCKESGYIMHFPFSIGDLSYMDLRSYLANLMGIDFYFNERKRIQYECPEELINTPVMNFLLHSDKHGEFSAQELKDLLTQIEDKIPEKMKFSPIKIKRDEKYVIYMQNEDNRDIEYITTSFFKFLKATVANNLGWAYEQNNA